MPYVFPAQLFNPATVRARVERRVVEGGESLAGETDVVATDGGGRWVITYSGIDLEDRDGTLGAWDAWDGHLAGGATECLVPLLSVETAPRPFMGRKPVMPGALVVDDDVFPTSAHFANPHVVATVGAAATLRATTLNIVVTQGAFPATGRFSIGDRAYRIVRHQGGDLYTIDPPLRSAVLAGSEVNFDWPVVKCRAAPGESPIGDVMFGAWSDGATITFVEAD